MSVSRTVPPRLAAALGVTALLAAGTACQAVEHAGAGAQVSDAVDELLAWRAVTVEASLDATPEEIYAYLLSAGGGEQPSEDDARRLASLELTASVGTVDEEAELRTMDSSDALSSTMVVSFDGSDAVGLKDAEGTIFARASTVTMTRELRNGDEAAVSEAETFAENAARLPASLAVPGAALSGDWVEVDPHRYDDYAEALTESGTEIPEGAAEQLAGALTDAGALLDTEAQWAFVENLESALRSSSTLSGAGQERGADLVTVRLPAGAAWATLEPMLSLLTEQGERFGLPPVVAEPTGAAAGDEVTAELAIRNGVLGAATFDLAQFGAGGGDGGGPEASLPLSLTLTGGSALSLSPPSSGGVLTPEDLTVALMYLEAQAEGRAEDEDRAGLPGPMQPGL